MHDGLKLVFDFEWVLGFEKVREATPHSIFLLSLVAAAYFFFFLHYCNFLILAPRLLHHLLLVFSYKDPIIGYSKSNQDRTKKKLEVTSIKRVLAQLYWRVLRAT